MFSHIVYSRLRAQYKPYFISCMDHKFSWLGQSPGWPDHSGVHRFLFNNILQALEYPHPAACLTIHSTLNARLSAQQPTKL